MDHLCSMLLNGAFGGYLAGILFGVVFLGHEKLANACSFGASAAASFCGLLSCIIALTSGAAVSSQPAAVLHSFLPQVEFTIHQDPLGSFFGLILELLGLALSVYSLGYSHGFYGRKNIGVMGAFFNLLLLTTFLMFLAGDAFFFLIAWELMTLSAYCLVSFEHEKDETRKAGVLYFIMSHIGTGCIILGFLLLFQASGGYDFEAFRALGNKMSPGKRDAVFLLFFIGFGIKAGIVPLHVWLPAAHPVAPSNVSAVMSGVLIKTGIYGMTRVFFEFLGEPSNWWGVAVLAVGTTSAVLGVLYALMEHDLKRLLAYHSVENIGIILMGLGAALMFAHSHHPVLASLALIAGLYHTINHAVFKALLFLGAGAVLHSTGTRNMEEMGGLAKRMRWTALFFLTGSIAISALPPLNGFVSEWLTYQSLLQGYGATHSLIRLMFPLSGAMLALTGALAAACFVKAFGITFLAQPRSESARKAHEAPLSMLVSQGFLAVACVFLGLCPAIFIPLLDPVTQQLAGAQISGKLSAANGLVFSGVVPTGGTASTLGIMLASLCLAFVPFVLWLAFSRKTKIKHGPTWDCGLRGLTPHMEYTATGFSKPIRMIFKALFRPHREVQREYDFSPYFARTIRFESRVEEVFEQRAYRPARLLILRASRGMRRLQAGTIQAYLIYIFVTLLALLFFTIL